MDEKSAQKLASVYYSKSGVRLGARSLAKEAGVSEAKARAFLAKQELAQIYKKPAKQKAQSRFAVEVDNALHQADLLQLPNDEGYKYALVVVDGHSRRVDAEPLKDKTAAQTKSAIQRIYARHKKGEPLSMPPAKLMTDSGPEFKGAFAKYMAEHKTFVATGEPGRHRTQALVEAANKEIGGALIRRQTAQELLTGDTSRHWVEVLPHLITSINRFRKPAAPPGDELLDDGKPLLPDGAKVRVALEHPVNPVTDARLHGNFRASDPRWETAVSEVESLVLRPGAPPMYRIKGKRHMYTRNRLLPVGAAEPPRPSVIVGKPKTYRVEEILDRRRTKGTNGRVEYKVKWYGYPEGEATWESRTKLVEDVPAIVKKFDKQWGGGRLTKAQILQLISRGD